MPGKGAVLTVRGKVDYINPHATSTPVGWVPAYIAAKLARLDLKP